MSDEGDNIEQMICRPGTRFRAASKIVLVRDSVIRHPVHKNAPVLGDGNITAATLLDWENACDDFFLARDPVAEDKKVVKVTGGLHNATINTYVCNNRVHLNTLTFPAFMTELCEVFLPTDWDSWTRTQCLRT
ncbi:hypothetical protein BYT27DRAFT_7253434 [Phlegmacium glaucopus]|nr:hypothetical protein BYT27DRAFT_7253434 [Phlegmacium glaucopus]